VEKNKITLSQFKKESINENVLLIEVDHIYYFWEIKIFLSVLHFIIKNLVFPFKLKI